MLSLMIDKNLACFKANGEFLHAVFVLLNCFVDFCRITVLELIMIWLHITYYNSGAFYSIDMPFLEEYLIHFLQNFFFFFF